MLVVAIVVIRTAVCRVWLVVVVVAGVDVVGDVIVVCQFGGRGVVANDLHVVEVLAAYV